MPLMTRTQWGIATLGWGHWGEKTQSKRMNTQFTSTGDWVFSVVFLPVRGTRQLSVQGKMLKGHNMPV